MGSVAVTFRIMPENPEVDLDALKGDVQRILENSFRGLEEQPVAFGLKAIVAVAMVDDSAGGSERLEAALARIPGVGSVEAVDVTLV